MARGNRIVVNPDAKGAYEWGYLAGAYYPGNIVQIDPTVALKAGKHTWKLYDRAADGDRPLGPFGVLVEDLYKGKAATEALVSGELAKIYIPLPGDELNLMFGNASGTADDVTLGMAMMVDDGTGEIIPTAGSPQEAPFVALEAITDPTADQLLWVRYSK